MATLKTRQRLVLHMFERVAEPMYIPKGGSRVVYNIPRSMLPENVRLFSSEVLTRFGPTHKPEIVVDVKAMEMPDLAVVKTLARGENFTTFLPAHRRAARALIDIFMAYRDFQDFLSAATLCRDEINEMLFAYALAVAVLNRADMKGAKIPPVWEIFPDKFVEGRYIKDAERQAKHLPRVLQKPVVIPRELTATARDLESRVAYFREDVGINSHHWHWHLVYPVDGPRKPGQRKGELFYYLHQQMLARYDIERQANNLLRVKRLHDFQEAIQEGYFPKLVNSNSSMIWASRPRGLKLQDIDRDFGGERLQFDINDFLRWKQRIFEAIHNGFVRDAQLKKIPLDEEKGIDILGDIVEASTLSPNLILYGDLHNLGHMALSFIHDPDGRFKESLGVMGDTSTAMRDPVFYRWHKFIDDIFQEHKAMLPPYKESQLIFPGVTVESVSVVTKGEVTNTLVTGWQESELELSRGLDFGRDVSIQAKFTHLQHQPFSYRISVTNNGRVSGQATVRIFIAPTYSDIGETMNFNEQRLVMIEMDKFVVKLKHGVNQIERSSYDSSVTIPFEQTFRDLEQENYVGEPEEDEVNFCGCGWPHHMLVPRGTGAGMEFQLFVMVTDWENDKVDLKNPSALTCRNAASYCGLLDEQYPDRRAMGFPFDRRAAPDKKSLSDFLTPNMKTQEICVQFTNKVIQKHPSA